MSEAGIFHWIRLFRTARHFPPAALWHRLDLRIRRKFYRPVQPPDKLAEQWLSFQKTTGWQPPPTFADYQPAFLSEKDPQPEAEIVSRLLKRESGYLMNEFFTLFKNAQHLKETLPVRTPLWRENYGYLEFLLPLVRQLSTRPELEQMDVLVEQLRLFWQLPFKERSWSTYGVSRRLITYCTCLPLLEYWTTELQQQFWHHFYEEAVFLRRFPEKDLQGNHLIKNTVAALQCALIMQKLPATRKQGEAWLKALLRDLPNVFRKQVLSDGFHYERTPMYHAWVLRDLLDCLVWLQQEVTAFDLSALRTIAHRMADALQKIRHTSGQIPILGDSSLYQTPDLQTLLAYANEVLGAPPTQAASTNPYYFEKAQLCVLKTDAPSASLIMDCGDFGPRFLPAHSHCDMGSFEVHVEDTPVIVDSGISEYVPSLLRDYFRGTAAHNTIWVPGEEQAEIWGSFRVGEYPSVETQAFEADEAGARMTLAYENYRGRYHHRRSVYSVQQRFWVVQDWVTHLKPADRPCYSLLHLHPDCELSYDEEIFTLGDRLLLVPYGMKKLEWSDQSPWRENLNLYSPGFNKARPGKIIALTPKLNDCFGWVLIPYQGQKPRCEKRGESVELELPQGRYLLSWDSEGLKAAFHAATV